MNNITNEQLDGLIKSAVNSSGPLPPDEKFSQIVSALRELRELRAAMLQGKAEPVSQRDELPELLEGMEVSVDVSTCDSDAGHRYFGTVTEVSELEGAKHGLILLVQDAEPNFKPAGNSPVAPDGWIKCSERLPEETKEPDGGATGYLVLYAEGKEPNGGFSVGVWNVTYLRQWWRGFITHWMPLPSAPQQEVIGIDLASGKDVSAEVVIENGKVLSHG